MKDKINTYIQFYLDEVELNISVKEDLTGHKKNEPLHNFGFFQITNGGIDEKPIFWDNINFFFYVNYKDFKEECGEDLKRGNFPPKKTYKKIKTLLKRAKKLNLL